jgi:hypothetical protein
MLAVVTVAALLILGPPMAVWRARIRPGAGWRGWSGPLVALVAPAVLAYLLVVSAWLFMYEGQCGGWLGETAPCRGFGQYAREAMYWAAMSMGLPTVLGLFLGGAVLSLRAIRRRRSGPASR